MHETCANCTLEFIPQPGYYVGAMYVSYLLFSALILPIAFLGVFYFKWSMAATMFLTILLCALTYIKFIRLARSLWIHMDVRYKAEE